MYRVFLPGILTLMLLSGTSLPASGQAVAPAVLDSIRTAYERVDFPAARRHIEAALASFSQFSPLQLGEVHTYYAQLLFAQDDRSGAQQQLVLALRLNPALRLDPLRTSPKLMALFEEVTAELEREPMTARDESAVRYLIVEDPRTEAALRSMILPGWGQRYKQETQKGIVLMGLWGLTAGGTLVAHGLRARASDRYLDATAPADIQDRYRTFNTWHQIRNNLFLSALGVWAYSYVDALVRWDPPGATSARVHLLPVPQATHLAVRVQF